MSVSVGDMSHIAALTDPSPPQQELYVYGVQRTSGASGSPLQMWEDAIPIERLVHGERTGRPTDGDDLRRESELLPSRHDRSAHIRRSCPISGDSRRAMPGWLRTTAKTRTFVD